MNIPAGGGGGVDPLQWYHEIPIVTRTYLTLAFLTTAACALDVVSPFTLYFNLSLIMKGQVWRLVTNFLFFGQFGLDFVFHMYFLVRYCRLLEEGSFRGRTADFVWMLLFAAIAMTCLAPYVAVHFLGSSLSFTQVYVWSRRNENVRLSFLGMIPFTAPYLPWVFLGLSMMLGHSPTVDLIGIAVGHTYYYFDDVLPWVAEIRGWRVRHLLRAPAFVHQLFGSYRAPNGAPPVVQDLRF